MSEALARTRHDAVLSGASGLVLANSALRGLGGLERLRRALPNRAHGCAGVGLAAVMTVIVVNALALQRERHPAPFFLVSSPISAASAQHPPEHTAPSAATESRAPSHALPPMQPSESGSHPEPNSKLRSIDPIGDMLHSEAIKDTQHLWVTAQNALAKLGYSKGIGDPDGADTIAGLRDFEKARGLSMSNDVTPRLVKLLTAAVNSSAPR